MKTQKELKKLYKEELKKAWTSEKMVNYCIKESFKELKRSWGNGNNFSKLAISNAKYMSQSKDCMLSSFSIYNEYNTKPFLDDFENIIDLELLNKIIKGYEKVIFDFSKRLNT